MKVMKRLLVLAGIHGNQNRQLGDIDRDFLSASEKQVEILKRRMGKDIEEKEVQFKVGNVGQINIKHNCIRELDREKFVEAVKNFKPTVLVLAFYFSHKSQLNDLLRAANIYSTILLRELVLYYLYVLMINSCSEYFYFRTISNI